jgi:hypothetical protein
MRPWWERATLDGPGFILLPPRFTAFATGGRVMGTALTISRGLTGADWAPEAYGMGCPKG